MDLPDKTQPEPSKKEIPRIVAPGQVKQVKRSASKRFFDFLFQESPKELSKKIGRDVLVPRLKVGFEDSVKTFVHGMLWGSGGAPQSIVQGQVLRGGVVAYNQVSEQSPMGMARQAGPSTSGNYQDLVFVELSKAEMALANLYDLINRYRVVAVGDLYEMAGITAAPSDNSIGWRSLDGARISKVRDGYCLELPRPSLI